MRTWQQLEKAFRELEPAPYQARLDYDRADNEETWRIADASSSYVSRFEDLARMAGNKILRVPQLGTEEAIRCEADPVARWYRAVVAQGPREDLHYITECEANGTPVRNIYSGSIFRLSQAAADLCLACESFSETPGQQLRILFELPRYEGPCAHWQESQRLLAEEEPNYKRVVHEAVSGVEGVARVLLDNDRITLGDALKELKKRKILHSSLVKSIEGVWGYSSDEPGVRHGARKSVSTKQHEAEFAVQLCEAALRLLLALDQDG
jgi:hypothetical protein